MSGDSKKDDDIVVDDQKDIEELLQDAIEEDQKDHADVPEGDAQDDSESVEALKLQLSRAQADYQNLIRRNRIEQDELGQFVRGKTVLKFLPIVDDFGRALEHLPDSLSDNEWVQGVLSFQKNLERILGDLDVAAFDSLGEETDPDRHDVISRGPGKDGVIIAEVERGYLHDGRVLRHAKVVVGDGSENN